MNIKAPLSRGTLWQLAIALLGPLLLLAFLVAPAWERMTASGAAMAQASADLEWLAQRAQGFAGTPDAPTRSTPTTVALERILQAHGLRTALSQMTEASDDRMMLSLSASPFEALVGFLRQIEADYPGALVELSVSGGGAGQAAATLVLQGGPG